MEVQDVKRWLMRGWKINGEIDGLITQKKEEWDRVTSITANLDWEAVDGTKDPHKLDRYASFDSLIIAKMDELYSVKAEIKEAIDKVEDRRYREVLRARYERNMTWEKIAVEMHYYYRYVRKLDRKALEALGSILEVIPMQN